MICALQKEKWYNQGIGKVSRPSPFSERDAAWHVYGIAGESREIVIPFGLIDYTKAHHANSMGATARHRADSMGRAANQALVSH
jgi:hypothetical protein